MKYIGICGAGLIGASWAVGFAKAGFKCLVYDSNDQSFKKFENVSNQLIQDIKILDPDLDVSKLKSNIRLSCTLEEICRDSILIQESIKNHRSYFKNYNGIFVKTLKKDPQNISFYKKNNFDIFNEVFGRVYLKYIN